jgi:hypothetical protein
LFRIRLEGPEPSGWNPRAVDFEKIGRNHSKLFPCWQAKISDEI